eukprot:1089982-Pelagomonas_calceolata.AAC.1
MAASSSQPDSPRPLCFPMVNGNFSIALKIICAAYVHGGKACCKMTFADTLKMDSASNIVAHGQHV